MDKQRIARADSVKTLFNQIQENHYYRDYDFPKGTYYKCALKRFDHDWVDINRQLLRLSEKIPEFTDAWYQGEGSSCGESLWLVGRELIIRLEKQNDKILKLGYTKPKGLLFSCGLEVTHYTKIVK